MPHPVRRTYRLRSNFSMKTGKAIEKVPTSIHKKNQEKENVPPVPSQLSELEKMIEERQLIQKVEIFCHDPDSKMENDLPRDLFFHKINAEAFVSCTEEYLSRKYALDEFRIKKSKVYGFKVYTFPITEAKHYTDFGEIGLNNPIPPENNRSSKQLINTVYGLLDKYKPCMIIDFGTGYNFTEGFDDYLKESRPNHRLCNGISNGDTIYCRTVVNLSEGHVDQCYYCHNPVHFGPERPCGHEYTVSGEVKYLCFPCMERLK